MSSISSRIWSTSPWACSTSVDDVGAGQGRGLEQRQHAGERGAQLVRDGRGEAGPQLLVGGHVAGVARIEDRLAPAVDLVRDRERRVAKERIRRRGPFLEAAEQLARPPARRHDAVVLVEDDDDLPTLLDEGAPASSLEAKLLQPRVGPRAVAAPSEEVPHLARIVAPSAQSSSHVHHFFTTALPLCDPRAGHGGQNRGDVSKVLIIEDDDVIAEGMARHLTSAGFDPLWVNKGESGLTRLRYERPDVCVLDLMLPGIDGWKLIETAREEGIGTPIVVVSARGTEHDRVHALEIGADDYLVKPFSMKELVARVRAAARRGIRVQDERRGEPIEIEELKVDPLNVQAYVRGESAELTPTEFRLLYALALEQGRVVTRDELLQKVWGRRLTHRDRTVDVFVRKIRDKLESRGGGAHVRADAVRRRLQARGRRQVAAGAVLPLGSRPVSVIADHMSRELLRASPDESIAEAAQHMVARGVGAVLVMDGERLEGILTERDILKAVAMGLTENARVRDWMTTNPETIEATDTTGTRPRS